MEGKLYLYPVWVRLWHWINAILCLLLIISGVSMQYSDPQYPFIRFDWAVYIHDISGIVLSLSYLFFILGNLLTPNGKQYLFRLKGYFRNVARQARYYAFGIFKGEDPPFAITEDNKFNPLQRFSYVFIMYVCIPVVVVTGWYLLYPEVMGFLISLFFVVHIYFCTIGKTPLSNFRSMFNGWYEKH